MQIEISEVNAILENILNGNYKPYDLVLSDTSDENYTAIYDLKNGLFIKEVTSQDSYGGEYPALIQFVKPKVTTITDYQVIN